MISPPQYKHKSFLHCRSFFFCDSFLKLKELICIGSGFDPLVGACFHGIMASTLYGPCIERYSCRCSNNRLTHCTAYVIAFVNVNRSCKFKSKSLISSRKCHRNASIRVLLSQSTSRASYRNLQRKLKLDKILVVKKEVLL
jgi:hypothetical protein